MKDITVPLSEDGVKQIKAYVLNIQTSLKSKEFVEFIASKAKQVLEQVTSESLYADEEAKYIHRYRKNHQVVVNVDEIILFNDTTIPTSELNPKIASNYPNGFDLAKAVEYGTGIVGATSEASAYASGADWAYDVNSHGSSGWFYMDNGTLVWTKGVRGRLIYLKTKQRIEKEIAGWVDEYISKM